MSLYELIGAIFGGGALQALVTYFYNKSKTKGDEFDKIIKTWSEDNDRLRSRIDSDEGRIKELEIEVSVLRNQVIVLESAHQDLPIPMWLKDTSCRMLVVNDSYTDTFLIPRGFTAGDYIGRDDFAVWPDEVAKAFVENDRQVLKTKKIWIGEEDIEDELGSINKWKIIKYPRFSGRNVIGIAGIAFPK